MPLRLLYSRHNHSQITQDELSTRVKGSLGSTQVHRGLSSGRGGRLLCCVADAFRIHFCFLRVYVSIDPSPPPPLPLSSERKTIMLEMFSQGTSSPGESVRAIWVIIACMEKRQINACEFFTGNIPLGDGLSIALFGKSSQSYGPPG